MKYIIFLATLLFPITAIADGKLNLDFVEIPKYRTINEDGVYGDILCYSKQKPFGDDHGRPTNVHETAHGIASEIRNEYSEKFGYKVSGFYDRNGLGIFIKEIDGLKIRQVSAFIPEKLRSYRFNLYFVKQLVYWDNYPSYILDEWVSYIHGAECAVDDYYRYDKKEPADCVSGSLEFSIYAIGLYLAVKEYNPQYINDNPQFKDTIKYYMTRADNVFFKGKDIFTSKKQENQLQILLEDDAANLYRELLDKEFRKAFIRR